jgi:RNA polymerase sigma factor (TIGR02999 family)
MGAFGTHFCFLAFVFLTFSVILLVVSEFPDTPSTFKATELSALTEAVYPELRRVARGLMLGENRGHTLQPTALVHEAVLRVLGIEGMEVRSIPEFFNLVVMQMRRTLVGHARAKLARKRFHPGLERDNAETTEVAADLKLEEAMILDRLLESLREVDARAAQVVELRFFAGLNLDEIAAVLELNRRTVARDWEFARSWLYAEMMETQNG